MMTYPLSMEQDAKLCNERLQRRDFPHRYKPTIALPKRTAPNRLLAMFATGRKSADLAHDWNLSPQSANRVLQYLKFKGLVAPPVDRGGGWTLTQRGRDDLGAGT